MNILVGDLFIYYLLECATLFACLFCGWGITKSKHKERDYWRWTIVIIAVFTFVKGLRYGRGVDYFGYAESITGQVDEDLYDREPVWLIIISFFRFLKISPVLFFVLTSFINIFSFSKIIKHFPNIAVWAFPMFYLIFGAQCETMVRQDCAISFLMLAYSYYLDKRRVGVFLFVALALFTHFSAFIALIPFVLLITIPPSRSAEGDNKRFWPIVFSLVYLFLQLFWDPSNLDEIANYISSIDIITLGSKQGYIDNASNVFGSEDAFGSVSHNVSLLFLLTRILANVIIIFYGYKVIKKTPDFRIAYVFAVIAIYINVLGGSIQIWQRIVNWFIYLTPLIICGIVREIDYKNKNIRYIIIATFFMCYYFYYIRNIGEVPTLGSAFIWDA